MLFFQVHHLTKSIMASVSGIVTTTSFCILFFISCLLSASSETLERPPIVDGLSWNFYLTNCPRLERIVTSHLQKVFKQDSGQAPALLRIFFHDCFVQVYNNYDLCSVFMFISLYYHKAFSYDVCISILVWTSSSYINYI